MGSFYFNVRSGESLTRDPKPYPFLTAQAARDAAIKVVRELLRANGRNKSLYKKSIEIADETGHPIAFVDSNDVQPATGPLRCREISSNSRREPER
jgi:hypothetical protein